MTILKAYFATKKYLNYWRIYDTIAIMATITIPKGFGAIKELIAVPRTTYAEFLDWQKKTKSVKTFKPTAAEKNALAKARREFARGDYITLPQLKHELGFDR